jgi:hypothetical protein
LQLQGFFYCILLKSTIDKNEEMQYMIKI